VVENPVSSCERCGAPTVEIGLLGGEHQLTMHSCSNCDHRSWRRNGERTGLRDVLDSVATTGRRRRSA